MKIIGKFNSINNVKEFIGSLQKEFRLTNFKPVQSLIDASYYSYDVSLSITEEGNAGSVSNQDLNINATATWGNNSPVVCSADFEWRWSTSSGHTVSITGVYNHDSGDGEFNISIGDDESESFYPVIKDILREVK